MHTCSIQSKTTKKTQENTRKNKSSKLESTPNQLSWKTERNSCTGYTGAHEPVHPTATGYTGAMPPVHPNSAAGLRWRKMQCHRIHRCPLTLHPSIHIVITQRACIWGPSIFFFTGYTGASNLDHRCIHPCIDQRLCSGQCRNFFSTGYTGASPKHAPVQYCQTAAVSDCQRLLFGLRVTGCTGATPSVYPVATTFWAVCF